MKKKQLTLLSLIFIFALNFNLKASHYMGGEITWECLPSGEFQFHLKYYRECGGITFSSSGYTLNSNSPAGNIYMSLQSGWPKDLTPTGTPITGCTLITCAWAEQTNTSNAGAVSEYYYVSAPVTINGVPPSSGWTFYHESCCRNPSTNLTSLPGWRLRAKMYPFNGQNTYPCYDNSPKFAEKARTVISNGYPYNYNHMATDAEFDSLVYEWGRPLDNNGSPITAYNSGYSFDNPLPGIAQDSNNVPATLDPQTGIIELESYTQGAFVTSVKASAYKCGILVAEIWRDIQVVLAPENTPPVGHAPNVLPSFTNTYGSNNITVYAGDTLNFDIVLSDFAYHPTNPPQPQNVRLTVNSEQFGDLVQGNPTTFSSSSGCLIPPCATLTPAPDDTLSNVQALVTNFYWETTKNHITPVSSTNGNCTNTLKKYEFIFKVFDDYCPIPASTMHTIYVEVIPRQFVESPKISCVKVEDNGSVNFIWNSINDTANTFNEYKIYVVDPVHGDLKDSIQNININSNTLNIAANVNSRKLYVCSENISEIESQPYDTVSTMFLEVSEKLNNTIELNWNPVRNDNQLHIYKIYKEYPVGNSVFYAYTTNTSYIDTAIHFNEVVKYRIRTEDSVLTNLSNYMCTSYSNPASIIATSIKNSDLESQITIYPNPADDIIIIEYGKLKISKIEVFNSNSKLVHQESELARKSHQLNLNKLASGTYFIKIFVDDKVVYRKLLIN